jgi:D-alanine-D-alanine ligase
VDEFDQKQPSWRIALTANLKSDVSWHVDAPHDAGAEFDARETIEAITAALQAEGHTVYFCPADHTLPDKLQDIRPDICFNIAEGLGGDGREAQVPALCELLHIPYTASRVVANAVSLDKTLTKRIWQSCDLPTAHFQEFHSSHDVLQPTLRYPLFVKPAREGTGMGMGLDSIVHDEATLREQVAWVIDTYQQPALVEEFLSGREFTVGFIGNRGTKRPFAYNADGYYFLPVLELGTQNSVSPGVYGYDAKSLLLDETGAPDYLCPADIPANLRHRLYTLTRLAAEAIGVCDVSRVDFRLDGEGEPHLLEINTLPGLNPAVSDLCIMARADGVPYQTLISEILYLAAERFGLLTPESSALSLSFGD